MRDRAAIDAPVPDRGQACLNCAAPLQVGQRFCSNCGQRSDTGRISLRDVGRDVMRAIVDVDRSALSLISALLLRPGFVAREYVDGRRRRYFSPFAFLVIVVGVCSLAVVVSGFRAFVSDGGANALADVLQRHVNLVMFLEVPILGLWCRAVVRSEALNFAEHMVLAAFASGIRLAFFAVVVIPFWYIVRPERSAAGFLYLYWAIWCGYFGFAASQFYSGNRAVRALQGVLVVVLTQATAQLAVGALTIVYLNGP
jgi:hypothetical protein